MIIDWHTHAYPPEDQKNPFWKARFPITIENVLAAHERGGQPGAGRISGNMGSFA